MNSLRKILRFYLRKKKSSSPKRLNVKLKRHHSIKKATGVKSSKSESIHNIAFCTHDEIKQTYSDLNPCTSTSQGSIVSFLSNTSTLMDSTWIQMYTDRSICKQRCPKQDCRVEVGTDTESDDDDDGIADQISKSNDNLSVLSNGSSGDMLIVNSSVDKTNDMIKQRLRNLRTTAVQLNIPQPVQISMLETIYDMKMVNLRTEIESNLKRFEVKSKSERSSLFKFIETMATTKRLLKNGIKLRSKSVDLDKNDSEPKHKNYFGCERDVLERKYEQQIRKIQYEILKSIKEIEIQMSQVKQRQIQEAAVENCVKCARQVECSCYPNNPGISRNEPKHSYSTEVSLQKRIRNRYKNNDSENNDRRPRSKSNRKSFKNQFFFNPVDTSIKYRNPNAFETMV